MPDQTNERAFETYVEECLSALAAAVTDKIDVRTVRRYLWI
jgi:hypothetical protein